MQSWWSANIATTADTNYSNMICQYNNAASTDDAKRKQEIRNSANASVATGAAAAIFVGTEVIMDGVAISAISDYQAGAGDNLGWYSYYCVGGFKMDTDVTGLKKLMVGDSISYQGGFRLKAGAAATTNL